MNDPVCPLTNAPCRHCSDEQQINIVRVGIIKTSKIERREMRIRIGEFCNNDGRHFIRDILACPVPAALAVPKTPYFVDELSWMRRRMA